MRGCSGLQAWEPWRAWCRATGRDRSLLSKVGSVRSHDGRVAILSLTVNLRVLGLLLFILATLICNLSARDAREQQRIDFLLRTVETSKGLVFIRNGSEYDGAAAAKHLRMKLSYAGERLEKAEDFVKYCATESSLTHRKYMVRKADGMTVEAASYFLGQLRRFDEKNP